MHMAPHGLSSASSLHFFSGGHNWLNKYNYLLLTILSSAKKAALWPMLHSVLSIQFDTWFEIYSAVLEKLWVKFTVHLSLKRIICPSYYRHISFVQIALSFDAVWEDCVPPSWNSDCLLLNCAEWLFPMLLLLCFEYENAIQSLISINANLLSIIPAHSCPFILILCVFFGF